MHFRTRLCFTVFLTMLGFVIAPTSGGLAADRLPDLGMAPLRNFSIDTSTMSGHRLLRYTTVIVNVGAGPFEVHGHRPDTSTTTMTVTQRVFDDAGGYRDVTTAATMFYSGDGHNHWHVRDLETSDLKRLDNGVKVGSGAKHGFCFFDNTPYRLSLPGAPQAALYRNCGTATSLEVTPGLSVGWGDTYSANLAFQYVDITGISNGRYRLHVTADASNWFEETNNANNATWADLRIRQRSVRVLAYGPSA
jgi:hypothetical protein